jgi:hypothetical protein
LCYLRSTRRADLTLPLTPARAIFPIVISEARVAANFRERLGTGFFIHLDGTFMTARHVLNPTPDHLHAGEAMVAFMGDGSMREITDIRLCPDLDIALGRVTPADGAVPLAFAEGNLAGNSNLVSYEYSNVVGNQISPSTRKGHCVSMYEWQSPSARRKAGFLELSFPAFVGASGAPVVVEKDGVVVGMIVGHIDRESGDYRLPIAMAISWHDLCAFGSTEGMDQKIFITRNLERILTAASEKLTNVVVQAAEVQAGIADNARVATVIPQREKTTIDLPQAQGHPHRVTCSLQVESTVEAWGGPVPLEAGWFWGTAKFLVQITVIGHARSWNGELRGSLEIERIDCALLAG